MTGVEGKRLVVVRQRRPAVRVPGEQHRKVMVRLGIVRRFMNRFAQFGFGVAETAELREHAGARVSRFGGIAGKGNRFAEGALRGF
jgi:hypothetical protein